ncbi:hypothetical protein ABMC88_06845 [Sulfitobacter sp. HNIBRBA2951]
MGTVLFGRDAVPTGVMQKGKKGLKYAAVSVCFAKENGAFFGKRTRRV